MMRELVKAVILAAPFEYQIKPYGEVLNAILKVGGAVKHIAKDKQSMFHYIRSYVIDVEVLENQVARALSELEEDKLGIRFDLATSAMDVVNIQNYYNLALVGTWLSHWRLWYVVNQDYYTRTPARTGNSTEQGGMLSEKQLQKLCGIMCEPAKQVGYGLRTYNAEIGSSSSSSDAPGLINVHEMAMMMKKMPRNMDHPLAFAMNAFQAFVTSLHIVHAYTYGRM